MSESERKPPKSVAAQVELMKQRHLVVEDDAFAMETLRRINYYRLRGYWISLQDKATDKFHEGTTFNTLLSIYEFDRKLRHLLSNILDQIEISVRTSISYVMSNLYGNTFYLSPRYFTDSVEHQGFVDTLEKCINDARKGKELFVLHHDDVSGGVLPIWAAVELMTFTTLSRFFRNLKTEYQRLIGESCYGVPPYFFSSWLQNLSNVRNIVAHHGRIYNKKIPHQATLFPDDKHAMSNKRIFASIFVAGMLVPSNEELAQFRESLISLINEYQDTIDLRRLGFPHNWRELLADTIYQRRADVFESRLRYIESNAEFPLA